MARRRLLAVLLMLPAAWATAAAAADAGRADPKPDLTQLQIARIVYDSIGGIGEAYYQFEGRLWERWETDHPQAEQNLGRRLRELTRIASAPEPAVRRLTAPDLGDFPLIFMSDVGYMRYTAEEAAALRAYLAKGGFLWADDFWGDAEWAAFERFMREVLPRTHFRRCRPFRSARSPHRREARASPALPP